MGAANILFAPGAGAPSSSTWMQAWKERLETLGRVAVFDYAYMREGRRVPDPQPRLIAAHKEALAGVRAQGEGPVVLVGKSMGSRIGCHVALQEDVAALVCLGYPLVSQTGALRDKVLLALTTPVLFVSGTRDPLSPLAKVEDVRAKMKAVNELVVVESGDHSLIVTKKSGISQPDSDAAVLQAIAAFLSRVLQGGSAGSGRAISPSPGVARLG